MEFSKREISILFILLIITIFFRFYHVSDKPFIKDEWGILLPRYDSMMSSSTNFIFIPHQNNWHQLSNYTYNGSIAEVHLNTGVQSQTTPLGWWLISLSVLIIGKNPLGTRFLPILFGILSIFIFYLIIKKVYGKTYALISAFLFSFYPFFITLQREAQTLEPISLFFFLIAIYSLLFFDKKYARYYWVLFMSLMFFSNFPKAVILGGIMFLWELQNLVVNNLFKIKHIFKLILFYLSTLVLTLIWAFSRAKIYGLSYSWFYEHVFLRNGAGENFRILEVLFSYGSTKEGALLIVLSICGLFIFLKSIYKKSKINLSENLSLLWLFMLIMIPFLLLFVKESGAWAHALTSVPIILFSVIAIDNMNNNIKKGKYLSYIFVFYLNWLYIIVVKNMGDIITMVPKLDSSAFVLYRSVFFQIISSFNLILEFLILTLFSLFIILNIKYRFISDKNTKKILLYSLILTLVLFVLHTFWLVISGQI